MCVYACVCVCVRFSFVCVSVCVCGEPSYNAQHGRAGSSVGAHLPIIQMTKLRLRDTRALSQSAWEKRAA